MFDFLGKYLVNQRFEKNTNNEKTGQNFKKTKIKILKI